MRSRTRSPLRTLVIVLLAVVVGIGVGFAVDWFAVGGVRGWMARHGVGGPYLPLGHRVAIGDRSLYIDCRGAGTPTIVLEAGMGSDSSTWSAVHDQLSTLTRTCAYDRPGFGRSDPRGPHTLADSAIDLRALLQEAGEPPPYLIVAHSLGGAYARVFAGARRDDVFGVLMVDTFDPDLQDAWIHPLLGQLRPEYEATLNGLRDLVARVEDLDWAMSEAQMRAGSMNGVLMEVLVAARYEPRLDEETNREIAAAWVAAFESLSPGRMRYTIAPGTGHYVHLERPDLVIEAVRRMLSR